MQLGKANLDFEVFDLGFEWMDGRIYPPRGVNERDAIASVDLYREKSWVIYTYDCRDGSSQQKRIDAAGNLVIGPAFIFFGAPEKTPQGYKPPSRKSKQATLDAFVKATGFSDMKKLTEALNQQLGSASVPVPWGDIRANHQGTVSYEVGVEADMVAHRVKMPGAGLPGDVFLLVPMTVVFTSRTTGVCEGEKFYDDFMHLSPYQMHFYEPPVAVHLSGPTGRGLQRDEAKKRVQRLEEEMKLARLGLGLDIPRVQEEAKAELERLRKGIDELIKY